MAVHSLLAFAAFLSALGVACGLGAGAIDACRRPEQRLCAVGLTFASFAIIAAGAALALTVAAAPR